MTGISETVWTAIDSISKLIMQDLITLASEQRYPNPDPDMMDDIIKDKTESVHELRCIRERLENITSGVILRDVK
jgi:hypothetical protein